MRVVFDAGPAADRLHRLLVVQAAEDVPLGPTPLVFSYLTFVLLWSYCLGSLFGEKVSNQGGCDEESIHS